MKCWECKRKISLSVRTCYLEYHIEEGLSKEKFRDVCRECYSKLKFNPCHYVEVNKITQRSLNKLFKAT